MAKIIQLTQGYKTKVSDEDYEVLSKYKWYAKKTGGFVYAAKAKEDADAKVVTIKTK